ncbi:MAG TPA: ABC transporter permease subunit [Candidatus Nanopelagicales bacterium]
MRLLGSELRLRLVSLIVWAVSIVALMLLIVAFYPSVRDNPSLNDVYGNLTPSMQALLGGSNLTSAIGYLNTQLFAFVLPVALLVFGLGRGAAAVAGEEEERTLDLLLAQPVARGSAYAQKSAALAIGLAVLTFAGWLPLVALNGPVRFNLPVDHLIAASLQAGLMCLGLSLAAQAIAAWTGRRTVGLAAAAGYAFASYIVYGLSGTVDWLAHLRPLTIWRWAQLNDPLSTGYGWREITVLTLTCAVCVVVGILLFQRRDLRA